MVSARVQLRVVAALYAAYGALCLLWIAVVWAMASFSQSAFMHELGERYASVIPSIATMTIACFGLSGLSWRLLALSRPWQIATAGGSLLFSLLVLWNAVRISAAEIPVYLSLEEGDSALLLQVGIFWGLALVYSFCSFLIWRQVRASNNRWRGP